MPSVSTTGAAVPTRRPGPLSRVDLASAPRRVDIDLRGLDASPLLAVRALLVADVLCRVLEHTSNAPVQVVIMNERGMLGVPGSVVSRLGLVHAPRSRLDEAALVGLGGGSTVTVAPADQPLRGTTDGPVLLVGGVQPERWEGKLSQLIEVRDPFNLRLALLHFPYAAPATLSAARLHRADETLDRWRFKVSYWKDQADAPARDLESLGALLANDLDTGRVLRAMHRMEIDHTIPSGAKYRTFAELDSVLALDLCRNCGYGHR